MILPSIRGLRFTIKGGEGSGNFGHAGRPGEVGGSAPGGEAGGKIDPLDFASNLNFANPLPKEHLNLIDKIIIRKESDKKLGHTEGNTVFLQPGYSPRIFAHEVGHVVAHNIPQEKRQRLINMMIETPLFTAINKSPLAEKYVYDPWRMTTETFSEYYAQYAIGQETWGKVLDL